MGRQESIFKVTGQLDGATFYKSSLDGYLVRKKTGIKGDRIKTDPAFERTRENGAEFGRAGSAAKQLRLALNAFVKKASDKRMASRLTREMVLVVQADETSDRGKRNVIDGEVILLDGFEFNINAPLGSVLKAPFTKAVNRAEGTLVVNFPAFVSRDTINSPEGATHCKFFAAATEIDFEAGSYLVNSAESPDIVLGIAETPAIALQTNVSPATTKPLFLVFGLEFFQRVNGRMYPIKTSDTSAMKIIAVDGGE